jgi:hypothetical protein
MSDHILDHALCADNILRAEITGSCSRLLRKHGWAGYGQFSIDMSCSVLGQLRAEAVQLSEAASLVDDVTGGARRDGSFTSPRHFRQYQDPSLLKSLLRDISLLRAIRSVTRMRRAIPSICSYEYYRPGDCIGLHRDSFKRSVSVFIGLAGGAPLFSLMRSLRQQDNTALSRLTEDAGYFDAGDISFSLSTGEVWLIEGYNVPYAVALGLGEAPACIAVLSYFDL